jgi:hypothetical protein
MSGTAAEVLSEGDLVAGRYVVEERIGKGGMGAVHAARDQRLGRRVALKALASRWVKGKARQRLEDEARAVAAIAHGGIVTLFDVVEPRPRRSVGCAGCDAPATTWTAPSASTLASRSVRRRRSSSRAASVTDAPAVVV